MSHLAQRFCAKNLPSLLLSSSRSPQTYCRNNCAIVSCCSRTEVSHTAALCCQPLPLPFHTTGATMLVRRAAVATTSKKFSYHIVTLLAGLFVFASQGLLLYTKHEHVRYVGGPQIDAPCPAARGQQQQLIQGGDDEQPFLATNAGPQHDYKTERKLRYDSSDASVFAMAQGYGLDVHRKFVGSLRKSGFQGTIMLATEPDLKEGVEEYLLSKNVHILRLNYTKCDNKILEDDEVKTKKDKECNTCIAPYQNIKVRSFIRCLLL